MIRVEQRTAPIAGGHRHVEALGEAVHGRAAGLFPAAAADNGHRALGAGQKALQPLQRRRIRPGLDGLGGRRVGGAGGQAQHIGRQADDHHPRLARHRQMEGARQDLGHPLGIIDIHHPLGYAAKGAFQVQLLPGVAAAGGVIHLAHEQDQGGAVLLGDMQADKGVGGARAAGDHAHARRAGGPAPGVGHHRRAAFLATDGDGDVAVLERVEHRQIAFAGHAGYVANALDGELVDQGPPDGARGLAARNVACVHDWSRRLAPGSTIGPSMTIFHDLQGKCAVRDGCVLRDASCGGSSEAVTFSICATR